MPDQAPPQKHPCPDCRFCQWCGDDRCSLCRGERHGQRCKLSQAEQIARYESLNRAATADETVDELRDLGLRVIQQRNGYRFSLDPLLLCDFASIRPGEEVADLGTGCGIIPLVLARRSGDARIVGVELQESLATLANRNVALNGLGDRITVIAGEIGELRRQYAVASFDLVVANPPFRRLGTGRVSPKPGRDLARHENTATLHDFLSIAKYLVKPAGRICFIHHPARLAEFLAEARSLRLTPLRLQLVHGHGNAEAKMFLVELAKGRQGDLQILPPLLVHGERV